MRAQKCKARNPSKWLGKIREGGVQRRAERYYQQHDVLRVLGQEVRRDLLVESKKHKAWKLFPASGLGAIRAALLIAIIQTPHRFRTKRQLWNCSGLGSETHDSEQYSVVERELHSPCAVSKKDLKQDLKVYFKARAI